MLYVYIILYVYLVCTRVAICTNVGTGIYICMEYEVLTDNLQVRVKQINKRQITIFSYIEKLIN